MFKYLARLFSLSGCTHSHLSRVWTPLAQFPAASYVTCLNCGQEFNYDWENMKIGTPRTGSAVACVVPANNRTKMFKVIRNDRSTKSRRSYQVAARRAGR